ncbi:MAG: Gfo/Idh/MocA family oxidoreductase [Litorilinea sp.]
MTNSEMQGSSRVRVAMVGCGRIGKAHLRTMLQMQATTEVVAVLEPSPAAYADIAPLFDAAQLPVPPNFPTLEELLTRLGSELDAVMINTPHAYHHDQAQACMEAGLDVLLEKPMVISGAEAESLMATRDRTGRLLVVAFPGSLSPRVRHAVSLLRSGDLGRLLTVNGEAWEHWRVPNIGTWRQVPEIAGGGFFFDTGAHLLNTVADLTGEDFVEVAAWLDNLDTPVEIFGVAMAKLASGALVTFNVCGDTVSQARSHIRLCLTDAVMEVGIWGEKLTLQRTRTDAPLDVPVAPSLGVWDQFLAVRAGKMANPCPPEVGLRMARLWDAIRASAAQGGQAVQVAGAPRMA